VATLIIGFTLLISSVLVSYGADLWVKRHRIITGSALFFAGIALVFFAMFPLISLLAPLMAGSLALTVLQVIPYAFAGAALIKLITSWLHPFSRFNHSNDAIKKDVSEIKEMLDQNTYQMQYASLNPLTLIRKYFRLRHFEDKVSDLRFKLNGRYPGKSPEEIIALIEKEKFLPDETSLNILKLALMTDRLSGKKVLFRNIDIEHRVVDPESYLLLEFTGKTDFLKRVAASDSKVHYSFKSRFKQYVETCLSKTTADGLYKMGQYSADMELRGNFLQNPFCIYLLSKPANLSEFLLSRAASTSSKK